MQPGASSASSTMAGVGLMIASCALLSIGDAAVKMLTEDYPIGEIIFVRSVLIAGGIVLLCGAEPVLRLLSASAFRAHVLRASAFAAATFLMVAGLSVLPMTLVAALSFTSPLLVTLMAGPVLGEGVRPIQWLTTLAGLLGVLLIVNPLGADWNTYVLLPLAAAICSAVRDIATRRVAQHESAASLVVAAMLATLAVSLFTLPLGWVMPAPGDL